jgi:sulfane dehydrogenase subunit SoxC
VAVGEPRISLDELRLAARNHALPLEALRYPITPTGLHYLLIHYDIPLVDEETYRLEIGGLVSTPLSLSLDDLRGLPAIEVASTMECAGNGRALIEPTVVSQPWVQEAVGTASWRGAALADVLGLAGMTEAATNVVFTGWDHGFEGESEQDYERGLPLDEARRPEVVLAYEMNRAPLLPQHGFPLRVVVPGWYGMTNVKWLRSITVTDALFEGYYHASSYRVRTSEDDPGEPVSRMLPRSLMIPPGEPEYMTRERRLRTGPCAIAGRAWSGQGAITGVDFSIDGAETWRAAERERDVDSDWAWQRWTIDWDATPGTYELCCRARDDAGNEQPVKPTWNLGGYVNNAIQRVPVTVV